ncbi:hypothetical protein ACFRCR_10130 [Oerskovia sp. NPDC056781]|uniref:hypothetical protein n=1 Tax=Oerskovia sp. NPDC056781 TaxID=3345942 RepID=UPI0036703545
MHPAAAPAPSAPAPSAPAPSAPAPSAPAPSAPARTAASHPVPEAPETSLRRAIRTDALAGLVSAPLLLAAAVPLAGPLGLPVPLLLGAGVVLLLLATFLWFTARRVPLHRGAARAVVVANCAWMSASVAVLLIWSPTLWGALFVVAQALAVLWITITEAVGLGRLGGPR